MTTIPAKLDLLLADVFDHRPTLEQGLPALSAGKAPKPSKADDSMLRDERDANPNNLRKQRWGIIVPKTDAGERALEAIKPLRALREAEQGAESKVYRVEPGMDVTAAVAWKNDVLYAEGVPEQERPRYLLILGDLDEVSAELGHVLATGSFVGRIHFDDAAGYAAYAEKVVGWEKKPKTFERGIAQFFVAQDGTAATTQGETHLVKPCIEMARKRSGLLFPADVGSLDNNIQEGETFVRRLGGEPPAVFLSVCHGAGPPGRQGFRSVEEQRRIQGALVLDAYGGEGGLVTAEKVASTPFLPGGLWFALACFGAGTPSNSAFYPWLSRLAEMGQYDEPVQRVLRALPSEGQKPFLAALPKAALANPQGPLAIVGHLDLAWTYGFVDPQRTAQSRASRIFASLQVMAKGSRVGVAHDTLMRSYREVNDELVEEYQAEEDARARNRKYEADQARRAHDFMLRNDLRGYVLLGDPAARLPIAASDPSFAGSESTEAKIPVVETGAGIRTSGASSSRSALEMEKAVLEMIVDGDFDKKRIAKKYNVTPEELDRWVGIYKDAGRAALGKIV